MNEREAAGILIEIRERIFSCDANPAEIHFHGDELGIGFGEKKVVRKLSAESLRRLKLEGMIVIAELDAGFFAFFAGFVEEIRGAFPAAGIAALLFVNPGTNDVAVADDFGSLKSFRPLFFNDVVADVAGRGNQAVLVEQLANVFRRVVEVSGEFDFFIASGGDFGDGVRKVGLHGRADGIELQANRVNGMRGLRRVGLKRKCGVRGPDGFGSGGKSCGDGSADKCASVHGLHFTPSLQKGTGSWQKKGGPAEPDRPSRG